MNRERFNQITSAYPRLRIAVVGDFCLDRYLEIDPACAETSIETGLPVHNVVSVRAQPGAAGTVLNNLVALRIGALYPVGFCGEDGEGYELQRSLSRLPGVRLDHFLQTPKRRTFTYCKPLVIERGNREGEAPAEPGVSVDRGSAGASPSRPPRELNRLDSKNWTPTPAEVEACLCQSLRALENQIDAIIIMDQVDVPETGVVTAGLLRRIDQIIRRRPDLLILADSRRGLRGYPPVSLKMNCAELGKFLASPPPESIDEVRRAAGDLARRQGHHVFITLAERGLVGAAATGQTEHLPALPLRGPIDIVGAGDSVSANLTTALAAGASLQESLELANAAASLVIHQLGTTGTATVPQLAELV